jgi:hypothetical protein
MAIKIENKSAIKLPRKTEETIQSVFDVVPKEHTRGLSKVVLVDRVVPDTRIQIPSNISELPGIYHPKMGNIQPFCEIGIATLLAGDGWFKRLAARLNFRPSLAYLTLSLQAQHYHLTLSHGIKKNQYEGAIRAYIDRYHKIWREQQAGWRAKLFKLARKLKKRYAAEQKRKSA